MNIQTARRLFNAAGALLALSLLSTTLVFLQESQFLSPSLPLFLVPTALIVAAIGSMIFSGNALGMFGPKYAMPALLLPGLGLVISYFWLRGEVQLAERRAASEA